MKAIRSKFALVQTAVERPFGFGNAIFFCGHRCYGYFFVFFVACFYGLAEDFFGEIIPADIAAFVGGMVVAVFLCFDHIYQEHGQVQGVGRGADLVADYPELIVGLSKIQHGLDEILAVFAEYPGDTDNEVFLQIFGNAQLTFQLGFSVYVQRFVILQSGSQGLVPCPSKT